MKKIFKRIFIIILIIALVFTGGGYTNKNIKVAKASSVLFGKVGIDFIIYLLIAYAAQSMDVNLPIPKNEIDVNSLKNAIFTKPRLWNMGIFDSKKIYNSDGVKLSDYLIENELTIEDINLKDWYSYSDNISINKNDIEEIVDELENFYGVPELRNKPIIIDKVENAYGILLRRNIPVDKEYLINSDLKNYDYMSILLEDKDVENPINYISIYAYNEIPKMTFHKKYIIGAYEFDQCYWWNNVIDLYRIRYVFNKSGGYWCVEDSHYNVNRRQIYHGVKNGYGGDAQYLGSITERLLFHNHKLVHERPIDNTEYQFTDYSDYLLGLVIDSDLSYRTFLASKYGGGTLGLSENYTIKVNLDTIGRVLEDVPEYVIDEVGSTDSVLEKLKDIDDYAQKQYGEIALSHPFTDVKPIEYPAEYTEILDVTESIDNNFNNAINAIDFNTSNIPEYLLVGLSFVAWVFGQMWESMGDYTEVLIFSASIALVALLFGLGLKREKTKEYTDVSGKSGKRKKK